MIIKMTEFPPKENPQNELDKMIQVHVLMGRSNYTGGISGYPWEILEDRNKYLVIEGAGAYDARQAAYAYGKRKGWKISGKALGLTKLQVGRVD